MAFKNFWNFHRDWGVASVNFVCLHLCLSVGLYVHNMIDCYILIYGGCIVVLRYILYPNI